MAEWYRPTRAEAVGDEIAFWFATAFGVVVFYSLVWIPVLLYVALRG